MDQTAMMMIIMMVIWEYEHTLAPAATTPLECRQWKDWQMLLLILLFQMAAPEVGKRMRSKSEHGLNSHDDNINDGGEIEGHLPQ